MSDIIASKDFSQKWFLLPSSKSVSLRKLHVKYQKDVFVFPHLFDRLSRVKNLIDQPPHSTNWDKAKRKTNPYELVHIVGTNVLYEEEKNSDPEVYAPLSRAFFKMIELYDECDIIPEEYKHQAGNIALLAEGPGGFMEALYKRRNVSQKIRDTYHGMTLPPFSNSIPGWSQLHRRRKHILHQSNIFLHHGNLYKVQHIKTFLTFFDTEEKKAFLVTCDGGFDYSNDFNNQEKTSFQIIFSEITTALAIQKKGGTLVCKVFDLFTIFSVQLIYLITLLYEEVGFFKPSTSRPANSEKYLVAKKFRGITPHLLHSMFHMVQNWKYVMKVKTSKCKQEKGLSESSMFSVLDPTYKKEDLSKECLFSLLEPCFDHLQFPKHLIDTLEHMNTYFTQRQESYIHETLALINEKEQLPQEKKEQIEKSQDWFQKHQIYSKFDIKNLAWQDLP